MSSSIGENLRITVFGKQAETCDRYLSKGRQAAVHGRIETGSYTNRDGQKVYTTDVVVEDQEFAESKNAAAGNGMQTQSARPAAANPGQASAPGDGFMNIPEGIDEELPFN